MNQKMASLINKMILKFEQLFEIVQQILKDKSFYNDA